MNMPKIESAEDIKQYSINLMWVNASLDPTKDKFLDSLLSGQATIFADAAVGDKRPSTISPRMDKAELFNQSTLADLNTSGLVMNKGDFSPVENQFLQLIDNPKMIQAIKHIGINLNFHRLTHYLNMLKNSELRKSIPLLDIVYNSMQTDLFQYYSFLNGTAKLTIRSENNKEELHDPNVHSYAPFGIKYSERSCRYTLTGLSSPPTRQAYVREGADHDTTMHKPSRLPASGSDFTYVTWDGLDEYQAALKKAKTEPSPKPKESDPCELIIQQLSRLPENERLELIMTKNEEGDNWFSKMETGQRNRALQFLNASQRRQVLLSKSTKNQKNILEEIMDSNADHTDSAFFTIANLLLALKNTSKDYRYNVLIDSGVLAHAKINPRLLAQLVSEFFPENKRVTTLTNPMFRGLSLLETKHFAVFYPQILNLLTLNELAQMAEELPKLHRLSEETKQEFNRAFFTAFMKQEQPTLQNKSHYRRLAEFLLTPQGLSIFQKTFEHLPEEVAKRRQLSVLSELQIVGRVPNLPLVHIISEAVNKKQINSEVARTLFERATDFAQGIMYMHPTDIHHSAPKFADVLPPKILFKFLLTAIPSTHYHGK